MTPPPPTPTLLLAPVAVILSGAGGSANALSANSVSVTDPDAPTATTFAGVNFDGDETIRVQASAGGQTVDQTYDYVGLVDIRLASSAIDPFVKGQQWRFGTQTFTLLPLKVGDITLRGPESVPLGDPSTFTGDVAQSVRLAHGTAASGASTVFGYSLIGDAAGAVPTTGAARFMGQAVGRFEGPAGAGGIALWGRAGLDIDFASGTVRGGVQNILFDPTAETAAPLGRYDFNYQATLSGSKFDTTTVNAPFQVGETGSVHGQLYGPIANIEVGGAFDLAFSNGKIVGGFVVGKPGAVGVSGGPNVVLRPSFVSVLSSTGGASATYDRNDIETGGGTGESVGYAPGGFVLGDEGYQVRTTGPNAVSADFAAGDYAGVTASYDLSLNSAQTIKVDTWRNGADTLNRFDLGVFSNGQWIRPAFVQTLEYVEPSAAPAQQRGYAALGAPAASMPTIGSARYIGRSVGVAARGGQVQRVTSAATIDVRFATGAVFGAFDKFKVEAVESPDAPLPMPNEVIFSGVLDGAGFDTTTISENTDFPVRTWAGHVRGDFFGPGADELGGIYNLARNDGLVLGGAFVAGSNPGPKGLAYLGPETFTGTAGDPHFATATQPISGVQLTWDRKGPGAGDDNALLTFVDGANTVAFTRDAAPYASSRTIQSGVSGYKAVAMHGSAFDGAHWLTLVEGSASMDFNYASLAVLNQQVEKAFGGILVPPTDAVYVAFGERTTDMPTTGSANYSGVVFQSYSNSSGVSYRGVNNAQLAMAVNFGNGAVTGSSKGFSRDHPPVGLDFTFNATISGAQFQGQFANADASLKGPLNGAFAGPGAVETSGTFNATTAPVGTIFRGGFVARKQ